MASELDISPELKKHSVHEAILALGSLDKAGMHAMLHYVLVDLEARIEASSELSLDEFYIPFVAILINFSGGFSDRTQPKLERLFQTTLKASHRKHGVLNSSAHDKQPGCVGNPNDTSTSRSTLYIRKLGEKIMESGYWPRLQRLFDATPDSRLTRRWTEIRATFALDLQSIEPDSTSEGKIVQVLDTRSDSSLLIGAATVPGSASKRAVEVDSNPAEDTDGQSSKRQRMERGAIDSATDEDGMRSVAVVEVPARISDVPQPAAPAKGSAEFRKIKALEGLKSYLSTSERGELLYDELVALDFGYSSYANARRMFLTFDRSVLDIVKLVNMTLWKRSKKFDFKKTFENRDSITVIKLLESQPDAKAPVLKLELKIMQRMGICWSPCGLLQKGIAKTAVFPTFEDEEEEEEIAAGDDED